MRLKPCTLNQILALLVLSARIPLMAQTNQSQGQEWLAHTDLAAPFAAPTTKEEWEKQRVEIRATLWELLGKLPPRPKVPTVKTVSREDRGDFVVEKFTFDNGAGATVPGYLLLPKHREGRSPGILFCHWHGGEYEIGKEELFQSRHTPGGARACLGQERVRRARDRCLLFR